MELYQILISAFLTIFSAGLLLISLASYHKYKSLKLLCVCLVFLVFLIHGILLSLYVFRPVEFSFLSSLFSSGSLI